MTISCVQPDGPGRLPWRFGLLPLLVAALCISLVGSGGCGRDGQGRAPRDAAAGELGGPEAATRRLVWALVRSAEEASRLRTPEGHRLVLGQVGRGDQMIPLLERHGLGRSDIYGVIGALGGMVDFGRIRPGQSFEIHLEEASDRVLYFRYTASLEEVYEVERQGRELVGRRRPVEVEWQELAHGGTLVSSIGETLAEQGAHPTLSHQVAEILSQQVSLIKELRFGDVFRVLLKEGRVNGEFLRYGPVLALEYTGGRVGRRRFFLHEPKEGDSAYYDERGISLPRSVLHMPVHFTRMTSPFGMRFHPVLRRMAHHAGVDLAAPTGTPVRACLDGKVLFTGVRGAYGNLIILDHGDGLHSYYAHLHGFRAGLRVGMEVKQRSTIGYVGSTGRSTGPHLHFGLQQRGKFVDPLAYRIRPGAPAPPRHRASVAALIRERTRRIGLIPILPPSRLSVPISDQAQEAQGLE